MKATIRVVLCATVTACPCAAHAQVEAATLDALKRQMEQMQVQMQQLQKKIDELEASKNAKVPAAATTPAPAPEPEPQATATAPAWSPSQPITIAGGAANYVNMSFDTVAAVGTSTEDDVERLELGDHDPDQRGFSLGNAELALDGAVDPYFKAFANVVFKLDEDNETFTMTLEGAVVGSPGSTTVAINDDDPLPNLAIGDCTVTEGTGGTTPCTFSLTLNPVSGRAVSVNVATANQTATAPGDYAALSMPVTIPAGSTGAPVTVQVNGDTAFEADETFSVLIERSTGLRVWNGGVPGYDTHKMRIRLDELLASTHPRLVLVSLMPAWDAQRLEDSFVYQDGYIVASSWSGRLQYRPGMPLSNQKCNVEVARRFLND